MQTQLRTWSRPSQPELTVTKPSFIRCSTGNIQPGRVRLQMLQPGFRCQGARQTLDGSLAKPENGDNVVL